MISFPPCKINLGLNVVKKRPDGYHDIETCFYPVPWTDILEIIPSQTFEFTQSGIALPGKPDENLCVQAYQLLKKDFSLPAVAIHLHKVIPAGAGLGGGSSNAAHTLRLLNEVFQLKIETTVLKSYASTLGSDCAFFLDDKPMLGTGRGEVLEQVEVSLNAKFIVLVKPDVHISTSEAYAAIVPALPENPVRDVIKKNISEWANHLKNDFEPAVLKKYSSIKEIKEKLYALGAQYASMSGSGSAVYGLFEKPIELKDQFPDGLCWSGILK
ncbi:MAG: 4-(cytidine 5'-diphospho)-2-C-methyl-D-erythritol kinase [Cyclobacteriaceae bacterium]